MTDIPMKLQFFTESVIREMTRVSNKFNAINLAQGYPDMDPPSELIESAKKALDVFNQYSITWGSFKLREAIANQRTSKMKIPIDPEKNVVITCGSTEAMVASLFSVCNSGERVVVFSPFYENYIADIILCGAQPIFVSLHPPNYQLDMTELENALKKGVSAIILCNPSNPC